MSMGYCKNALELCLSCTNPLICFLHYWPSKIPFRIFFVVSLHKLLDIQLSCRWVEMAIMLIWCQYSALKFYIGNVIMFVLICHKIPWQMTSQYLRVSSHYRWPIAHGWGENCPFEAKWHIYAQVNYAIIGSDNGLMAWSVPSHYLNQWWFIMN